MWSFDEFLHICFYIRHLQLFKAIDPQPWSINVFFEDTQQTEVWFNPSKDLCYNIEVNSNVLKPRISSSQPHWFSVQEFCKSDVITSEHNVQNQVGDGFNTLFLTLLKETSDITIPELSVILTKYEIYMNNPSLILIDQLPDFSTIFDTIILPFVQTNKQYTSWFTIKNQSHLQDDKEEEIIQTLDTLVDKYQHSVQKYKDIYMLPIHAYEHQSSETFVQDFNKLLKLFETMVKQRLHQRYTHEYIQLVQLLKVLQQPYTFYQKIGKFSKPLSHPSYGRQVVYSLTNDKTNFLELIHKMLFRRSHPIAIIERYFENKTFEDDFELIKYMREKLPIQAYDTTFNKGDQRVKELERFDFFSIVEAKNKVQSYLDFGGQSGQLAMSIQEKLKLKKEQVYVADIKSWSQHEFQPTYQTQWLLSHELPYENESFDLITCFQVLHHVHCYQKTLSELYRILKRGGFLLIREHDVRFMNEHYLTDVEHTLFEQIISPQVNPQQNTDICFQQHFARYFSRIELRNEFKKHSFQLDIKFKCNDYKGPTRYYYELWVKV